MDRQWTAGVPETDRFGLRLEAEHRLTPRLVLFGARQRRPAQLPRLQPWLDGPEGDVTAGRGVAVALPILRFSGNAGWSWTRANQ